MVTECKSVGINGIDGYMVEVEASAQTGLPAFDIVDCPTRRSRKAATE